MVTHGCMDPAFKRSGVARPGGNSPALIQYDHAGMIRRPEVDPAPRPAKKQGSNPVPPTLSPSTNFGPATSNSTERSPVPCNHHKLPGKLFLRHPHHLKKQLLPFIIKEITPLNQPPNHLKTPGLAAFKQKREGGGHLVHGAVSVGA